MRRLIVLGLLFAGAIASAEGTLAKWKQQAARLAESGRVAEARLQYEKIVEADPDDGEAWRELGRMAMSTGDLAAGRDALGRASKRLGEQGGVELHYLLGEAHYASGDERAGASAHEVALRLLLRNPTDDRMTMLWRARIYARKGNLPAAAALYEQLEHPEPARAATPSENGAENAQSTAATARKAAPVDSVDKEAWLNHAEAYLLHKRFADAERVLRDFLALVPDHERGLEMLAFALEGQGDVDRELPLRERLLMAAPTDARRAMAYASSLERAGQGEAAIAAYKNSQSLAAEPSPDVSLRIGALEGRTAIEMGAQAMLLDDPLATTRYFQVGAALPFASGRHHFAVAAMRADADGSQGHNGRSGEGTIGAGALVLRGARQSELSLRLVGEVFHGRTTLFAAQPAEETRVGGSGELVLPASRFVLVQVRGAYREAWRESAVTFLEAATQTMGLGRVYVRLLDSRLILDIGGFGRRLELLASGVTMLPSADQLYVWAGADVVLWVNHDRRLGGDMLDDRFLSRWGLASALVLTARHYYANTSTTPEFATRLALVDRAVIEELGMVFRHVMAAGRIAAELRGAAGYDSARSLWMTKAGVSVVGMPSYRHRLVLSYDFARETATTVSGERHVASLSYRMDWR